MSLPPEATELLSYLATLRKEQSAVILAGKFTQIEEYRAGCTVIRNLERLETKVADIFKGQLAAEALAEEGLTEFHNPKDDKA